MNLSMKQKQNHGHRKHRKVYDALGMVLVVQTEGIWMRC